MMPRYNTLSAVRLLANSSDPDAPQDRPLISRCGNPPLAPGAAPVTVIAAGFGHAGELAVEVHEDGLIVYDDAGDQTGHPEIGASRDYRFPFWVKDTNGAEDPVARTATIVLTSAAAAETVEGTEVAGYVLKLTAAQLVGSALVDPVSGVTLAAVGAPVVEPSLGGEPWIRLPAGAGFYGPGSPDLPIGNEPWSLVCCLASDPVTGFGVWGGYVRGGIGENDARGFLVSGATQTADFDTREVLVPGPNVNDGQPFVMSATFDGSRLRIYHFANLVAELEDVTMETVAGTIRIMRNAHASAPQYRPGAFAAAYEYDRELTASEIWQMSTFLVGKFVGDLLAPVVTGLALVPTGAATAVASFTINEPARVQGVVTSSAVKPSNPQILAGRDEAGAAAMASFSKVMLAAGSASIPLEGLTGASCYLHVLAVDAPGNVAQPLSTAEVPLPDEDAPPTSISPLAFNVSSSTPLGVVLGRFTSDQVGTFSKVSGPAWLTVLSNGDYMLASTPPSGQGAFVIRVVNGAGVPFEDDVLATVTVPGTVGGDPADYEARWDELPYLLNSWGGVVPGNADRVIAIKGPYSGTVDLTGVKLNRKTTIRPIAGSFGADFDLNFQPILTSPAKLTGQLKVAGTRNLHFTRLHHQGQLYCGEVDGRDLIEDLSIDHSALHGPIWAYDVAATDLSGQLDFYAFLYDCARVSIKHSYISHAHNALLYSRHVRGLLLEGNVYGTTRHDAIKVAGNTEDMSLIRNWFTMATNIRTDPSNPTKSAHTDALQIQNGAVKRVICWGNVLIRPEYVFGRSNVMQGLFASNGPSEISGWDAQQNIVITHAGNAITSLGTDVRSNHKARYNTVLRGERGAVGSLQDAGGNPWIRDFDDIDYNIVTPRSLGQNHGAGPNGIPIPLDSDTQPVLSKIPGSSLFSGYPRYAATNIDYLLPPSPAARSHWQNPNPCGAYLRLQEIFEGLITPEQEGWPVDAAHHKRRAANKSGLGYTGNYDQWGNAA